MGGRSLIPIGGRSLTYLYLAAIGGAMSGDARLCRRRCTGYWNLGEHHGCE